VSAARRLAHQTFAALSVRNFRLYFWGQVVSVSGTWMQSVAQGWLVLQITHHNAFLLGISIALQYLPMLLVGSYGGVLVDRRAKRPILYATQGSSGILALILGVCVLLHLTSIPLVFTIAFLNGVSNMFDVPARQAFVQEMVGRDLIANAVSLNSVIMNAGRLIGPAIAALFIALTGTAGCFIANSVSYIAVLLAIASMRDSELTPIRREAATKGQLRSGLTYAWGTPLIRTVLLSVVMVGTFAFNFTTTLPVLVQVSFHNSHASAYGYLLGSMGLGAVLGGLYIARRSRPTVQLLVVLAFLFATSMTVVALAPTLWVAALALVVTGASSIAFVSTCNATLQLNSREEYRGRVMSLHGIAFLGTTPIGSPLVGAVVTATNPRVGLLVGSTATMLVAVGLAAWSRQQRASRASN
jgi:MFS family permease